MQAQITDTAIKRSTDAGLLILSFSFVFLEKRKERKSEEGREVSDGLGD